MTSQDGRYLRLKNITIDLQFAGFLAKKDKSLKWAHIYVTGTDLETTRIKDGWDPEQKPEKMDGGKYKEISGVKRYPFTRNLHLVPTTF